LPPLEFFLCPPFEFAFKLSLLHVTLPLPVPKGGIGFGGLTVPRQEVLPQLGHRFLQVVEPRFGDEPWAARCDPALRLGQRLPHRAQRAALRQAFPELCVIDAATGLPSRSAIDTVERFQGGERTVILVSATESDPAYLLMAGEFLLDPRRLTVALSRAKRKMVLVASRSVFSLFSPDEETFANSQLWKNLLLRTCTTKLWAGERDGRRVEVWGGK